MYRFSSFFFLSGICIKPFLSSIGIWKNIKLTIHTLKFSPVKLIPFFLEIIFHLGTKNSPKISRVFLKSPTNIYIAMAFWKVCGELDNFSIFHIETVPTTVSHLLNLLCMTTWGRSGVIKKLKSKWNCARMLAKEQCL